MEVRFPVAVHGQLQTLNDAVRHDISRQLYAFAQQPELLHRDGRPAVGSGPNTWIVRLSHDMRALLQVEPDYVIVLALASRDQLLPFVGGHGAQVA